MAKKVVIAIFLLVLTLSLGACSESENKVQINDNKETKAPTMTPKVDDTNEPINQQKQSISNDLNYIITEFTDSKSTDTLNYNIKYPQLSGLSDVDKQKQINNILKDEALKVLKYYEEPYGGFLDVDIEYKITLKTMTILSIQYSGDGYVSHAAHPNNLFYTTNINIKTGKRLRLTDIVNIDEDFASKFLNDGFKALWPEQRVVLQDITNKEIQRNFKNADSLDNIGTEKKSDVFSYFTNDSMGISISVSHAIGDHAEFEIKYQDIKNNIKSESEIWNDLLSPALESSNKKLNLNDLQENGFEIFEDQSFWTELEGWGKVRFVSGEESVDGTYKLQLYLVDDGTVIYKFPEFYGNQWSMLDELEAVSFQDVNMDGLKDILIIADYMTGVGPTGAEPFPVGSIYFQKGKEFHNIPELDDEILDEQKNESVEMILNFVKGKHINLK